MDEELLAGLTDEERQALEDLESQEDNASEDDPEVTDEDLKNQKPDVDDEEEEGDDNNEGEGDEGDDDEGGEGGDEGAGDGDDEANDGADDGDDGDEPGTVTAQQAPIFVAEAPADAEAKLQEIADKKAALVEQFDDGELTAKEYQQQLDALNKEERAIERALDKAQIAADMEHQRQVNEREATINAFLTEHQIKRDPKDLRFVALDAAVRIVASQEENAQLGVREILQKAFDECVSQGLIQSKKPKAEAEPKQEKKPVKVRKQIDAPKTLANVPASEISDTSSARFAHINRIKDPEAREAAFMKLSPAEQEAYLQSGA